MGYRNEEGKVRHRVVDNLGRLEDLTPAKLDPLIGGLNRALGRAENPAFPGEIESSKAYGNVFALHELWNDLKRFQLSLNQMGFTSGCFSDSSCLGGLDHAQPAFCRYSSPF